jgi:hypothetical protein
VIQRSPRLFHLLYLASGCLNANRLTCAVSGITNLSRPCSTLAATPPPLLASAAKSPLPSSGAAFPARVLVYPHTPHMCLIEQDYPLKSYIPIKYIAIINQTY